MIIIFKLLGAFFGMRIAMMAGGAPASGLVVGGLIGHSLDVIAQSKLHQAKARKFYQARANEQFGKLFVGTLFAMVGKLAMADGEANKKELEAVERLIDQGVRLKRREKKEAWQIFRGARSMATSFQFDAAQYYELYQHDTNSLENLIAILFGVAAADGQINATEERMIRSAATVFNMPDEVYNGIRANYMRGGSQGSRPLNGADHGIESGPNDPYSVLGCKRDDSVTVIKQNYRKLVSDFHPDKIVHKNLPEEFTKFASEKFKTIQSAYEQLKAERGFN